MVDPIGTIIPLDQYNGPTISNAEFFIESLFGSKSRLEVRDLRISPSRRGFLVEIDIRRKVKKSAKKAG
jgi:hypothetical protein